MEFVEGRFLDRKRIRDDVFMYVEYTEATWSIRQAQRDLYQNHLDAQMAKNIDISLTQLCSLTKVDIEILKDDQALRKLIYLYFAIRNTNNSDAETDIVMEITKKFQSVGANDIFIEDAVYSNIEKLTLELPEREYLVQNENNERVWIKESELTNTPDKVYRNAFAQKIFGVKMRDTGSGYDVRFKSIFDPTKQESPEQAGKFGEGAKVSDAYLKKYGYEVISRSSYRFKDQSGEHHKVWQARPRSEGGRMVIRGALVEIDQPVETGSLTEIIFPENQSLEENLQWDPRVSRPGGNEILWLEKSLNRNVHYPGLENNPYMIGLGVGGLDNYVQGIRVSINKNTSDLYFNYVSWDKRSLDSRDRNKYSDFQIREIENLWIKSFDSEMARQLVEANLTDFSFRGKEEDIAKVILSDQRFKYDLPEEEITRWRAHYFSALKRFHNYNEKDRYIILKRRDSLPIEDRRLLDQLEKDGYKTIETFDLEFGAKTRLDYLGANAKSLEDVAATLRQKSEDQYSPEQMVKMEEVRSEVNSARDELVSLLKETVGDNYEWSIMDIEPVYVFGNTFSEEGFGRTYNAKKRRFDFMVNVDSYLADIDALNRRRLLQTFLLISMNKYETDANAYAQGVIDVVLETAATWALPEDAIDINFRSSFDIDAFLEAKNRKEEIRIIQESTLFHKMSEPEVDIKTLKELADFINRNPASDLLDIGARNLFTNGNKVSRIYLDDKSGMWKAEEKEISGLEVIGESRNSKIRRFGNFVFAPVPPFRRVIIGKDIVFNHKGSLYRSKADKAIGLELEDGSYLRFNTKMAFIHIGRTANDKAVETFSREFNRFGLQRDAERSMQRTELTDGLVKTSLSSEYGREQWDDPMRFFEDIAQNHIDAGGLELKFLVLTYDSQERWVSAEEVKDEDAIIGVEFSDSGSGYTPEKLRDLGSGEKISPTEAGKYGEGLKMILAAATRNQIEFEASSVCISGGKKISWKAVATLATEMVAKQGELREVNLSAFNLSTKEAGEEKGSRTKIVFKDTQSEFYRKCLSVMDPRIGKKHKGLARYVRALRKVEEDSISTGPVTILKDEDEWGKIYENGLLVADVSDRRDEFYFGGIDVPSVTSTRERNDINSDKMADYLNFYLYHTDNDKEISNLINLLNSIDVYSTVNEKVDGFRDLRLAFARQVYGYMPNNGKYKMEARKVMGNRFTSDKTVSNLPTILNSRDLLRVNKNTHHEAVLSNFIQKSDSIMNALQAERVQIDSNTRKKVDKIASELVSILLEGMVSGRLPSRAGRKEILNSFKNPTSREKNLRFTRVSKTHYGKAYRTSKIIEINESSLERPFTLPGTWVHELTHLWNDETDNQPKFMSDMLSAAFYLNSRSRSL